MIAQMGTLPGSEAATLHHCGGYPPRSLGEHAGESSY